MQRATLASVAVLLMLVQISAYAQIAPVPELMAYQGRLVRADGTPIADGTYAIRFSLWTASLFGAEVWNQSSNVQVRNGSFGVLLSNLTTTMFRFNRYLEIKIGTEAPLPRRQLTTVAHAFKADSVSDGAIRVTSFVNNAITRVKLGPDVVDTTKWLLGGNANASASSFLGTTNTQPLHLRVNNRVGARYVYAENTTNTYSSPNIIGGSEINLVDTGMVGETISGGGRDSITGIDSYNGAYAAFGAMGGGEGQRITGFAGVVMGGRRNDSRTEAAIAGGSDNWSRGLFAAVGGGSSNSVSSSASYGVIPGGLYSRVSGINSFAAGTFAVAGGDGTFAWASVVNADFSAPANNEFAVRAHGGVRIITAINSGGGQTAGVTLSASDSGWNSLSDRDAKTGFADIDREDFLNRFLPLPLSTWNYKSREDIRHLGPMAQDMYSAFGFGVDDRHISMVDADGSGLAALQGLARRLEAKRARLAALETENAELRKRLEGLTAAVEHLAKQPQK
jgi:hypothetical protein